MPEYRPSLESLGSMRTQTAPVRERRLILLGDFLPLRNEHSPRIHPAVEPFKLRYALTPTLAPSRSDPHFSLVGTGMADRGAG